MRKVIAAINMTLDGYADHTAGIANDETHEHYNDLMRSAGVLVYGRITYQLMESYWPLLVADPSGNKPQDDFAILMDNVPKLVFSRTLRQLSWDNAKLASADLKTEIDALKQLSGKDIFIGSPGMIAQAAQLSLIDEFQIAIHPVILGQGLVLFKNITNQIDLKLQKTKVLNCGVIILYYQKGQ